MSEIRQGSEGQLRALSKWTVTALSFALAACGGGDSGSGGRLEGASGGDDVVATDGGQRERAAGVTPPTLPDQPTSQRDAVRLADQASFGPTEALIKEIRGKGAAKWIASQMAAPKSSYTSGGSAEVHQVASGFCTNRGPDCWRDWFSTMPLLWDFYRNAIEKPDQLRQRVALALQQILVVSGTKVEGTYGFRNYHNMLLDQAFGNFRSILKKVALSPVMGSYQDNANNNRDAPNENFSRELLQLFSLGTCELNMDGSLRGGNCVPTYNNDRVRDYAHALTGWTYPSGAAALWPCWPRGANCPYYAGDMIPLDTAHDTTPRTLLAGVSLPEGHSASQALEAVLDSLMKHPNIAPFIGKQLIQHLVTSNPSPAYVQRVAAAFVSGKYQAFGDGVRGDMMATVAAVLLDPDARTDNVGTPGRLREPALFMVGMLRALNGRTDGNDFAWWWGDALRQHVFRAPSVFNFYPASYPLPVQGGGSELLGPAFGIHNVTTALGRLNFITFLLYWGGSQPVANVPNAIGTKVNLATFGADAMDPTRLVDRLSMLALGQQLPGSARDAVIEAVEKHNVGNSGPGYLRMRVQTAVFLVFGSPYYQVVR